MDGHVLNFCQRLGATSPDPASRIAYHINLEPPLLGILHTGLLVEYY